ncbi:MAG: hypothetical protein ACTSXT_05340 [Candidatus Helarchaeota archaeon]
MRDEFSKSPVKRIAFTSDEKIIELIHEKFMERVKRYSRAYDTTFS